MGPSKLGSNRCQLWEVVNLGRLYLVTIGFGTEKTGGSKHPGDVNFGGFMFYQLLSVTQSDTEAHNIYLLATSSILLAMLSLSKWSS